MFSMAATEGAPITLEENVEQIIDMLVADKIDPQAFISNYEYLVRDGMPSLREMFVKKNTSGHRTLSIEKHFRHNRARAFPLWFYGAYPDVMSWFHQWQKDISKTHDRNLDSVAIETAKLFGVNIEDETIDENGISDSKGNYRPEYLRNLVNSWRKEVKAKLEVSSPNLYEEAELNKQIKEQLGITEDNFAIIARCTAEYYFELKNNYQDRFNNETDLLATAGFLDAKHYILVEKSIDVSEIQKIAEELSSDEKESILEFIIQLEILLFGIDSPDMDKSDIENACLSKKQDIQKVIEEVQKTGTNDAFVADVQEFMNSSGGSKYREILGIKS